jgi:hypothetical protein
MKKISFVGLFLVAFLCLQAGANAQTQPLTAIERPSITVQLSNGEIMFLDGWVQNYLLQNYLPYSQNCLQETTTGDSSGGLFEQYKLLLGAAGAAALTAAQGYFTAKTRYTKKLTQEQTT